MKYLESSWPELETALSSRGEKLFLLDFDGTLASIAGKPEEVILEKEVRTLLVALARRPRHRVAVVSGRSLRDLLAHLPFHERMVYVGNHGLEWIGGGLVIPVGAGKTWELETQLGDLTTSFRTAFRKVPGVLVEDKGLSVALHFRNVKPRHLDPFRRRLRSCMETCGRLPSLCWIRGKKVWELRARAAWSKGEAARYLMRKFPKALPIAIGDDRTDESMFEAVSGRGLAIRVGNSRRSKAQYYLKSPAEVRLFLERLCR